MPAQPRFKPTACAAAASLAFAALQAQAQGDAPAAAQPGTLSEVKVLGTAEEELKQALGVSTITEEDLAKRPPANDLSQIIRTMPGVNLTGNSATGQYGNHRQIDLRGMGPENTLILIDGKPVHSRDSVRMGRSGERNTRGDTNWVPAEAIERIEVLRGPAAARYGSGAAGGVINIITKAPSKQLQGSVSAYYSRPQHDQEGGSRRLGFSLAGPVADKLSFRLYGNLAKTEPDSLELNRAAAANQDADAIPPAGREGVRNRDLDALLRWDVATGHVVEFEAGVGRQGNIYAGDRAVSSAGTELIGELAAAGAETNTMIRRTTSVTHRGRYDFGSSRLVLQYENTDNTRLNEGLAGSGEGSINTPENRSTSSLDNWFLNGEVNVNLGLGGFDQVLTVGFEYRQENLDDPFAVSQGTGTGGSIPGIADSARSGRADAENVALFLEDNIEVRPDLILTPGLRVDKHSKFGNNWSPSLNASFELTPEITIKGGIARAFKAPNLYQSNPNYLYFTMGNGCPVDYPSLGSGCYVQGNANLDAETSVNKEIGIAYSGDLLSASLTYFHNDYRNKIVAGIVPVGQTAADGRIFQWTNAPKAVVRGFEGNLTLPLARALTWTNNLTYMIENKNKTTDEPLSIIPRYTVNTTLDWEATDQLSLVATGTYYGRQEPRRLTTQGAAAEGAALDERGSYAVYGVNLGYALTRAMQLRVGVDNLFDKRLFRAGTSSSVGAATYNEPGRAYYVSVTSAF